jgi:hypothetical protein
MDTHLERPLDGAKSSDPCRDRLRRIETSSVREGAVILQVAIGSACLTTRTRQCQTFAARERNPSFAVA